GLLAGLAIHQVDQLRELLLAHDLVDRLERDLARADVAQQRAADRGRHQLGAVTVGLAHAQLDRGLEVDLAVVVRHADLGDRAVDAARRLAVLALPELAPGERALAREVIEPQHDVLRRHDDRLAVGGRQDVVGAHHEHARFHLRLDRQRDVDRHLVAVEVGVERRAHQRVELDRLALGQHRLERLDAEAVQRRCAVEQHRVLLDDLLEDVPHLGALLLDQLLGGLDRGDQVPLLELVVDERREQLERHLLGQAALVQLELGTDHDHRAARVIDALAEQVLAEATLLALQHVAERLQRTLVGAGDDAAAAAVVEQSVDRLLQHAFLVADDDIRRPQLDQPLETVVAVDDAPIEIIEIGRGETSTVQRHQRPQIGRYYRYDRQDHPLRLVAGGEKGFDQLKPLGDLLLLDVAVGFSEFGTQLPLHLLKVDAFEHLADRL